MLSLTLSSSILAQVKQSKSGICHDAQSKFYERTKKFISFNTLEECLAADGRLPKNYQGSVNAKVLVDEATKQAGKEGRAYSRIYNRDDFKHWTDKDSDCQNERAEQLIRQSSIPVTFTNNKRCTVKTGKWFDPYTGQTFTLASDVDIDHIVTLKAAFDYGAWAWTDAKREQFANDPINLIAVEDNINQSKSAKGLSEFLPPVHSYRCEYIERFNNVMTKYQLIYPSNELRVVTKLIAACGIN